MKNKWIIIIVSSLFICLLAMIIFSPYGHGIGQNEKSVVVRTTINASPSTVYNYLGNSDNAEDWSVYVDHITSLNPDQFADGSIGASRRCFQSENEKGIYWDETILINEKNKKRRLNIYNMHGFSMQANSLLTEQIYREVDDGCELMFTLFFEKGKSSWIDEFKMYYAAYMVESIFKGNLARIKLINEDEVVLN